MMRNLGDTANTLALQNWDANNALDTLTLAARQGAQAMQFEDDLAFAQRAKATIQGGTVLSDADDLRLKNIAATWVAWAADAASKKMRYWIYGGVAAVAAGSLIWWLHRKKRK